NGSVSQLRVGTVDLGSGIDPGSLRVCVRGSDGSCSNRAGTAEKHGVTLVDLGTSLSDPNTEIYASVRDLAGNTTEVFRSVGWFLNSSSANIGDTGTDTQAPRISITSPVDGAVSGVVPVAFSYSDNVAVASVEFYVNGSLHSTSAQAPFSLSLDTTKLASGSYTLNAIAFDAERNQGVSNTVTVTVSNGSTANNKDTQTPVISIASPATGSTVSGNVPVSFSYSDNVAVTAIDLYVNGQLYGKSTQAPFTFALDTTKLANGNYSLTAHAFDAAGNQGVSGSVSVAVSNTVADTQSPVINIASPAAGSTVSGNVPVSFSYSDNVAVTAIDFYVNGQLHGRSTQAPFTLTLDTTKLANGSHSLAAQAFDAAGNKGVSANVTINVDNAPAKDAEKPSVNIISPVNGQIVSGPIQVAVDASDNVGVSYVDFHINGNLVARDRSAPYQFSLNGRFMMKGDHVLTARAYDAAGNQGVSSNVTITVK
ncbi:MAG: Ig-like domain-containing protein, partial [Nitrosomonas sp.]|nr:Ig-like domain-containing protein [Nitrosomonas sp.]